MSIRKQQQAPGASAPFGTSAAQKTHFGDIIAIDRFAATTKAASGKTVLIGLGKAATNNRNKQLATVKEVAKGANGKRAGRVGGAGLDKQSGQQNMGELLSAPIGTDLKTQGEKALAD